MTGIKRYRCDICKKEYNDAENALICENSHQKMKDVTTKYAPRGRYPIRLVIQMEDDKKLVYIKEERYRRVN